jgi:hypothetical protein
MTSTSSTAISTQRFSHTGSSDSVRIWLTGNMSQLSNTNTYKVSQVCNLHDFQGAPTDAPCKSGENYTRYGAVVNVYGNVQGDAVPLYYVYTTDNGVVSMTGLTSRADRSVLLSSRRATRGNRAVGDQVKSALCNLSDDTRTMGCLKGCTS